LEQTPDTTKLLTDLADRYRLSSEQSDQLMRILRAVESDELAPTTVRDPRQAIDVHLADSLVALELEVVHEASRIADIGSGAGFPGLPLAVALPAAELRLVDSQARKCAFVGRVVKEAEIGNVEAVCARVEEWPEGIGVHDLVLARAVAPQPIVLEYAAPLLRLGGSLLDWRGQRAAGEERAASEAGEVLGLRRESIERAEAFEGVRNHHLHVYRKVAETPDRFPRRSGMARKRPLAS
jgi:16S rRNA (guanine527-N7)-methyltransferase